MVVIRRIAPDEWRELRSIRLAALEQAPSAFGSTLSEEERFGDDVWHERAAGDGPSVSFVAVEPHETQDGSGERWVGLVAGIRPTTPPSHAQRCVELVSMWTAPSHRGRGIGEQLVAAVVAWATDEVGADEVRLWVMRGNEAALRLYRRCGFEVVDADADPADPCAEEIRMGRRC